MCGTLKFPKEFPEILIWAKGCVLDVVSAPDASAFNTTGVFRDVRLRTQLQPTEGGGKKTARGPHVAQADPKAVVEFWCAL